MYRIRTSLGGGRGSEAGAEMRDYHGMDCYRIMGVGRQATATQIRAAYRGKARMCHPDVCGDPNSTRAFIELAEAYGVLSDAEKRRDYDAFLDRDRALDQDLDLGRDQASPRIPVRLGLRLRPMIDRVTRWLPEDPLPFLMQALQFIGLSLAAVILLLAALYIL